MRSQPYFNEGIVNRTYRLGEPDTELGVTRISEWRNDTRATQQAKNASRDAITLERITRNPTREVTTKAVTTMSAPVDKSSGNSSPPSAPEEEAPPKEQAPSGETTSENAPAKVSPEETPPTRLQP